MSIKIPFNPVALIKSRITKKKIRKTNFANILSNHNTHSSNTRYSKDDPLTLGSNLELQQTLVQNLLRVNELKNKDTPLEKSQHPALKYDSTQQNVQTFLLSSIGTKQQRNIEILIKDLPGKKGRPHSKDK